MSASSSWRGAVAAATVACALVVSACSADVENPGAPEAATSTTVPAPVTTTAATPAAGFDDHQQVAGYTIARVPAPQGASLPEGVGDVAVYDITTAAGSPVARYMRITPAGGAKATDATVQSLLAGLAAAHGGGTPQQATIAGLASWEVSGGDGTVGIARASEDGPVVVFLGTDRGAVESMIDAVSAALDAPR